MTTMKPKEYLAAIEKLGLTQAKAGEFVGFTARQSRRWISGDYPVPAAVAMLLRLMLKHKVRPDDLAA